MTKVRPKGETASSRIRSMRNRRFGWASALGELIDNAVGNGAKFVHVSIDREKKEVRIIDDGVGCDEEKFCAIVSLGQHVEDESVNNTVSRYGIGAKDAFIWLGGPTRVYSARGDENYYIDVPWDSFGEEWDYPQVISGEKARKRCAAVGLLSSGVAIVLPAITRPVGTFDEIHKSLSGMFWAAVETGVRIVVDCKRSKKAKPTGGPLPGKPMPQLIPEHSINSEVTLSDGRLIRIVGGVLQPQERTSRPGFEYIYGHRVIVKAGGLGAGNLDFERCYFRVFLLGEKESWNVETNKDGLHDSDEGALGEAVFMACRSILEHGQSEAMAELHDQELLDDAAELVTQAHRKHAKRNPTEETTGTAKPTGAGGEHQRASNCHDRQGKYEHGAGRAGGIKIKRAEFEPEKEHLVGEANVRDRIVRLNVLHPEIKACLAESDRKGIARTAVTLWSAAWICVDDNGQARMFERDRFDTKLSAMLAVVAAQYEPVNK